MYRDSTSEICVWRPCATFSGLFDQGRQSRPKGGFFCIRGQLQRQAEGLGELFLQQRILPEAVARARDFDLTKDDFIKIMRIKDYDSDIAKAGDDGYVRGKNEKIDMTQRRKQGTGLPVINGGGGSARRTDEDPQITRLNQMKDVY